MKRLILTISACLVVLFASSQLLPESSLRVSYIYEYNTTGPYSGKSEHHKDDFLLLASPQYSYFYGVTTHYLDSIYSNPKSRSEYIALRRQLAQASPKSLFDSDGRLIHSPDDEQLGLPTKGSQIQVIKDMANNSVTIYDALGDKKYRYLIPVQNIDWEIEDSTKNILGFDCILATAIYCGRKWNAWFCQDIPIFDGPWQLQGLPGIILLAESDDFDHTFIATGVEAVKQIIAPPPIPLNKDVVEINRNEFLKMKYNFILNPTRSLKERGFSPLNPIGQDNLVKHDFLETDYK